MTPILSEPILSDANNKCNKVDDYPENNIFNSIINEVADVLELDDFDKETYTYDIYKSHNTIIRIYHTMILSRQTIFT